MLSIEIRNRSYVSIISGLAVIVLLYGCFKNPYYLIGFFIFGAIAFSNTMKIRHRLLLLATLSIVGFPVLLLTSLFLSKENMAHTMDSSEYVFYFVCLSAAFLIFPFLFIYYFFSIALETSLNEKKFHEIIEHFPHLICRKHFTRTKEYSSFGYKSVNCRIGTKCLRKGDIQMAVNLVGLIGLIENGRLVANSYYVTLWDHRFRKIRYGDFDIIEIHENEEIKDYDYVISKVITFFYNEIYRYKPLREASVRIVGNPAISENTRRMLHKHFLKVEYLTP